MNLPGENKRIYEFEDFRLIPGEGLLLQNGTPISLNPKTFAVLVLLVERHGHLISKSDIIHTVWSDTFIEEGAIAKAISRLRNALGDSSKERFIQTFPKRGYRFVAPVLLVDDSPERPRGSAGSDSVVARSKEQPQTCEPTIAVPMPIITSSRSSWARRTAGVTLLLTAVIVLTYLFVPHERFQAAGYLADRPIPDVKAASNPVEYRPLALAENAYLKGVFYFDSATNSAKTAEKIALVSKAIAEFEKAVSIDTRYAEAYASLARAYHWLGSNSDKPEAYVKAKVAALAAIELDPSNAKAHASLAWVYWRLDWDWVRAEAEYRQVLDLSRNAATPLSHGYALFISAQGRHDEAIEVMRQYEAASPLSIFGKVSSAYIKLRARKYDEAEMDFRRILELDPEQDTALSGLAITLTCLERYDEAIAVAQRARGNYENPAQRLTLAWVFARSGRTKDSIRLLAKAEQQFRSDQSTNDAFAIAKVYAGLGEIDKAFAWLEKAFEVRSQYLVFLGVSPEFHNLKSDERFAGLLKRLGLFVL